MNPSKAQVDIAGLTAPTRKEAEDTGPVALRKSVQQRDQGSHEISIQRRAFVVIIDLFLTSHFGVFLTFTKPKRVTAQVDIEGLTAAARQEAEDASQKEIQVSPIPKS